MREISKVFPICSYIYIVLPILLFVIGWCNLPVAIVGTVLIGISLYFICKNAPSLWLPKNKKEIFLLIACLLIALGWVYLSGIGALVFQNADHACRNPIFEFLVTQDWPVILQNGNVDYLMTYYIAFWLPAAVVGKIFNSIQIGYYMQIVWATIGVFLSFYYILSFLKNKNLYPLLIFIFFSGLDILGCFITLGLVFPDLTTHLEWWFFSMQFSSFTTQLFWVFNQALPAWLMTLVLLKEKNNKNILFLYSCLFIHSTLPAIGLFPIIIYIAYRNSGYEYKKIIFSFNKLKKSFCSIFTFQNIIAGAFVLLVSYLYLSNNISGGNTDVVKSSFKIVRLLLVFFLFIPIEVGIYFAVLRKYYKGNLLFHLTFIMFLTYPFFKVGYGADFCMRATIPALVILYLYVVKTFDNPAFILKDRARFMFLTFILCIGAMTPIHEFYRTIYYTDIGITKIPPRLSISNFFSYTDNNTFLKYAGKINKNTKN